MSFGYQKVSRVPTFELSDQSTGPVVPNLWSFSALRDFDECPKRWGLSHKSFSLFAGPFPQKPSRKTTEGILLHELLENYGAAAGEKFRPRQALLLLLSKWREENRMNPRIDSTLIAGQIAVEEILRAFKQATAFISPRPERAESLSRTLQGSGVRSGSEVWLRDPKSKLYGRADHVESGEIIDFKTGENNPTHVDQLLFYAALYFAATKRRPEKLTLVYTRTGTEIAAPVPGVSELESLLSSVRMRAESAERSVAANDLRARPERTKCRFCHVRAACDEYWSHRQSWQSADPTDSNDLTDYEKTPLARFESATFGIYIRDILNSRPVTIYLPGEKIARNANLADAIRVLSVRRTVDADCLRLALTELSEIYLLGSEVRCNPPNS